MKKGSNRKTSHGEGHFILMTLLKGPQKREAIVGTYHRFGALLGIPPPSPGTKKYQKWQREVDAHLEHLKKLELVKIDGNSVYSLTEQGIQEAIKLEQGFQKFTGAVGTFLAKGETAAKLSVIVNVLLSVLKLGVGFIFNSVALIADGFDNMVDVVSALVVFLGIKYKKELISTIFIVLVMFATVGWIGYEAIIRLISPEVVDAGVLPFVAAAISGLVCYLMSAYQYTVGRRIGSLSLLSQSIDSKNHVLIAIAVIIGIAFARFNIFIIDSIVALGVAALILKSAIELTTETLRIAKGEGLDISRFARIEERMFESHRRNYFKWWLLLCLREINTKEEIIARYTDSFSTEGLPFIDQFGFLKGFDFEKNFDSLLKEAIDKGLVVTNKASYYLTKKGDRTLKRSPVSQRYI